jgi:phosphohistidine phosphatase
MHLIIVRHGKADQSSPTGRDEDRPLKPRGERQAEFLGQQFAERPPALILTSRYERAFTTARLIQRAVGSPLHTVPELEGGRQPSAALELIASHTADPLMLVGHNPQLAELVWILTRGMPAQDSGLRTGEVVLLEIDHAEPVGTAHELERLRSDDGD